MPPLVTLRGTGESLQNSASMLGWFFDYTQANLGEDVSLSWEDLNYYAEIAPIGMHTLSQSVAHGKLLLEVWASYRWTKYEALIKDGTPASEAYRQCVWYGAAYSLGALSFGDWIADNGDTRLLGGTVLVADPRRSRDDQLIGSPGIASDRRFGICRERNVPERDQNQVVTVSIWNDPISSAPYNNGIREIADVVAAGAGYPENPFDIGFTNIQNTITAIQNWQRVHIAYDVTPSPADSYLKRAASWLANRIKTHAEVAEG